MLKPHLQILNERFLSRYGVDRILLLMANHFAAEGARISYGCSRYTPELFAPKSSIIQLPPFDARIFQDVNKFANAEKIATDIMLSAWMEDKPDIIVVGGWPFFDLAARAESVGTQSVFIDAGAVPHTGYQPSEIMIQEELRRIRGQTLPFISRILPISDFIRYSQTEPERRTSVGVRTIHLGADHLQASAVKAESTLLTRLMALQKSGTKLLLAAGRFEPVGYKNSMSAIHVARGIRADVPNIRVLALQPAEHMPIPDDMRDFVEGIGFPTDYELLEIIRLVDLTLSTSLWEGFNLPFAESQLEGCPTLVYACGSHPEVTADPWFLCQSEVEMADKSVRILTGKAPAVAMRNLKEGYATRFTWKATLREIWNEVRSLDPSTRVKDTGRRLVFIDVGSAPAFATRDDNREAAKVLCAHLIFHPSIEVVLVQWNQAQGAYTIAEDAELGFVTNPLTLVKNETIGNISIDRMLMAASQRCVLPPLLLIPHASRSNLVKDRVDWAQSAGLTVGRTVYDAAVAHLSSGATRNPSAPDTGSLGVDFVICNSVACCERVRARAEDERPESPPRLINIDLREPDERRNEALQSMSTENDLELLAVDARGPANDSEKLLKAFQTLRERLPHKNIRLSYVSGAAGSGLPDGVTLYESPSDEQLAGLFAKANIVICPSVDGSIELIARKSLSIGRPCILHDEFLRFEDWGGCYAADMRSSASIANAIEAMSEDGALLAHLTRQASAGHVRDWSAYVDGVAEALYAL